MAYGFFSKPFTLYGGLFSVCVVPEHLTACKVTFSHLQNAHSLGVGTIKQESPPGWRRLSVFLVLPMLVIEQASCDGVSTSAQFEGGVGDIPDGRGETPVENLVEGGGFEFYGGGIFPFAGVDLQEGTFLELNVIECQDTALTVVRKASLRILDRVDQKIVVEGVDVFLSAEGNAFTFVVAGIIDTFE